MTTPAKSMSLPSSLLARSQQAQVETDEANARKAATDADTSALQFAQAKYKSLVPDLTGVTTNAVDDKSAGVAFSGLVTYSALNHAAETVAYRISTALPKPAADGARPAILVTSRSDLLTNDLLQSAVQDGLDELIGFADRVLALQPPVSAGTPEDVAGVPGPRALQIESAAIGKAGALTGGLAALAGGAGAAALGPFGIAAAAAAAIPSIVSLFSSTTTVKSQSENITDLATMTSVMSAVSDQLPAYVAVHEDFRLAPATSAVRAAYQKLATKRTDLVFRQEQMQAAKNAADLELARAQQKQDAAKKAAPVGPGAAGNTSRPEPGNTSDPGDPGEPGLAGQVAGATAAAADATAALSLVTSAISSIDAFTGAVNATAAGARSPLAIASLNEQLRPDGADRIGYVLSVKGLGGQSEEYTKDRHVGFDTYTTLADASIAFMLYDTGIKKIISSGVANGVSSVHGQLGKPPTGLLGPNAADAIEDLAAGSPPPPDGQQAGHPRRWWRRMFGGD